jgi:predicted nucleotidyltransferase
MKSDRATLILRLPVALHRRLKQEARSADLSLNEYCRGLLARRGGRSSGDAPVSPSLSLAGGRSARTVSLADLVATLLAAWEGGIEGLVLFGSLARGRQTRESDVDLLVVLNRSTTLDRDVYARCQLPKFDGREVSPLFAQIPEEGERVGGLWFEVALDGVVLYDRDLRLSRFLVHVRHLVADGRAKRMHTHGHPYWVHSGPAGSIPGSLGGS